MNSGPLITSAALYFDRGRMVGLPLQWFEAASSFLEKRGLTLTFFCADGGGFLVDEFHDISALGKGLIEALRNGQVETVGLQCPSYYSAPKANWRAMTSISLMDGLFYLGIDAAVIANPHALLSSALDIAADLLGVRYGIAYRSQLSDDPDCYAAGVATYTLAQIKRMINADSVEKQESNPLELWGKELVGEKRHLRGFFRGAYPANLLSQEHIDRVGIASLGVGRLTRIQSSLWMWELSESELPVAQRILAEKGAIISAM